jgi:hypothetical protein
MLNLEHQDPKGTSAAGKAWRDIRSLSGGTTFLPMSTPDELWGLATGRWDQVRAGFARDFRMYDGLLHKLHYLRRAPLPREKRRILLRFLTIGYLMSDDVRYFNEFLWFAGDQSEQWQELNVYHFHKNTEGQYHCFPLASREEVNRAIHDGVRFHGEPRTPPKPLTIGALGLPFLFDRFRREMTRQGYPVDFLFFPDMFPGGRFWGLLGDLYGALWGGTSRIVHVKGGKESPKIGEAVRSRQIALAVHRLPFIIRANIHAQMEYGLLNDHWGPLPFIRGRSTPEYSLLFGLPLVSTVHLVDGGIDTGAIVKYFRVTPEPPWTMRRLKRHLSRTKQDRYADAVTCLAKPLSTGLVPAYVNNDYRKGLQYYSMHPALSKYVERHVLTSMDVPTESLRDAS